PSTTTRSTLWTTTTTSGHRKPNTTDLKASRLPEASGRSVRCWDREKADYHREHTCANARVSGVLGKPDAMSGMWKPSVQCFA
ncbi:unnamed protein product, partial [Ectocarpus sp. 8 AP-2014]